MSEDNEKTTAASAENKQQKQNFALKKIYVKDVSFESPNPVKFFTQPVQPKINLDLNTESAEIDEQTVEVNLNITVTATTDKEAEQTIYLVEIKQSGIFQLSGFAKEELHRLVNCHCPNILFPFAREAIANLVERAGFPQLLLAPINFEGLYQQHLEKLQQAEKNPPSDARH